MATYSDVTSPVRVGDSKQVCGHYRGSFITHVEGDATKPTVEEREWTRTDFHFDDVGKAMLTLFTVSTFEGWPR